MRHISLHLYSSSSSSQRHIRSSREMLNVDVTLDVIDLCTVVWVPLDFLWDKLRGSGFRASLDPGRIDIAAGP